MSQISLKSISGITSITTPAGVDNQLTVHTNDTTEKLKVTTSGLNVTGVVTASNFVKADGSSVGNTVNNNANNRVITGSDSANTLEGEANMTFNGSILTLTPGPVAGNITSIVLGRTSSAPTVQTTAVVKGGGPISGVPGIIFGSTNTNLPCVALETANSSNGHIVFKPKGTEMVRIDSDGDVSISPTVYGGGGTSPQLYIRGTSGRQVKIHNPNAATSSLQITNATTGQGEDAGPQLFTQGGTGDFHIQNAFATGDIAFGTKSSGGSTLEAFRLNSSGHFHLGRDYSSNPQNGLVGIVTIRGHRVNEAGDYAQLYFRMSTVGGHASSSIRAFRDGNNYSNGLSFYTHSSNSSTGDGTEKLKIDRYGTMTQTATTAFQIAKGTTAQRPSSPVDGMIRFNTTLTQTEEYRDGGWKGMSNKSTVQGGTTTTSGGYTIHTFTSSGTLTVSGGSKSGVDYLIVAGGGGGGNSRAGGGGGGGMTVTTGATLAEGSYTITVGGGGGGSTSSGLPGATGSNTSLGGVASVNGGGGGGGGGGGADRPGLSGGSGGGGSDGYSGGAGTSGQGSNGGGSSGSSGGGGGGGKGGVGNNGDTDSGNNFVDNNSGGNGGNGGSNNYSGSNNTYGAGGGGGSRDDGPFGYGVHGAGNGGRNNSNVATAGSANRGGGGGGGARLHGSNTSTFYGANGGSGIVIVRYLT